MSARPLVFIDTETTSLDPATRLPWEVAWWNVTPHGAAASCIWHIEVPLDDADEEALKIGCYHERMPPNPSSTREAAEAIHADLHGVTLVGANIAFDAQTLTNLLALHGLKPSWHYRLIDIESLVAGSFGRVVGGLRDCLEACGLDYDPGLMHTALYDALQVRRLWDHLMGAVR